MSAMSFTDSEANAGCSAKRPESKACSVDCCCVVLVVLALPPALEAVKPRCLREPETGGGPPPTTRTSSAKETMGPPVNGVAEDAVPEGLTNPEPG